MTEQRAPAGFWRFPKVAQLLTVLLYSVHVLVCIFLIFVVLLQQGKGADLSVFGGGTTQTAFGARGATTLLHKLTVGSFIIFVITTLAIGLPQLHNRGTVMSGAKATKPATPAKTAPAAPGAPAPAAPAKPAPAPGSPR
jgi:preprotein translocase subunit SecG